MKKRLSEHRRLPHVTNNSGKVEWYTPPEFIESARSVLGRFDLDPASCPKANRVVKAKRFYTKDTDGLQHDWNGKVWLNPPYSNGLVGKFIDKLIDHFEKLEVSEAIVLTNNATDTKWFQKLCGVATGICFPTGRIRFWGPNDERNSPLQGQAFVYCGKRLKKFIAEFKKFGLCCALLH